MQPHEERVLTEKRELDDKLIKLRAFVLEPNPVFERLSTENRSLLEDQYATMTQYSKILGQRIALFPKA